MSPEEPIALEIAACTPYPVPANGFNPAVQLPYGLTTEVIRKGMEAYVDFLGFLNTQLLTRKIERLESMLMAANFSSIVGEFMISGIPKHTNALVKNRYHNGHPDLIPAGRYPNNAVQHDVEGVEVKASRYHSGWQGHNAEDCWLMVFVFDSNGPADIHKGIAPRPFRFVAVYGAQLEKADWNFSGRSETSRRTITASVTKSGFNKMTENWIYKAPDLKGVGVIEPAVDLMKAPKQQDEE